MKMEPIVSSETSAIRTQTPGNYPKRNNLHLEHGESLRTRYVLQVLPVRKTSFPYVVVFLTVSLKTSMIEIIFFWFGQFACTAALTLV